MPNSISEFRVQIAPDIEVVINAKPQGQAEVPGASITAYYKGVQVADALYEYQDGHLCFYINEISESDEPVLLDKYSVSRLEDAIKEDGD